jgi:hypothetical protein
MKLKAQFVRSQGWLVAIRPVSASAKPTPLAPRMQPSSLRPVSMGDARRPQTSDKFQTHNHLPY